MKPRSVRVLKITGVRLSSDNPGYWSGRPYALVRRRRSRSGELCRSATRLRTGFQRITVSHAVGQLRYFATAGALGNA
jgi:hypothetical protein